MRVWRLCRERHLTTVFSGEGARLFAARWNSAGTPMVYTSWSLSLAMLEVFIHLKKGQAPDDFVAVCAELPDDDRDVDTEKTLLKSRLPHDWKADGNRMLRQIGDDWVKSGSSLALFVPSVIVDREWNVLVNPMHPRAQAITILEVEKFYFDQRLFEQKD